MNSIIHINVLYFAVIREITNIKQDRLELSNKCTIKDLLALILERYPEINRIKNFKISVNYKISNHDVLLKDGDEVAFLPPISGG